MTKEAVVFERSATRYMSDQRQRGSYSKSCGLAAEPTRPYRPLGDLSSMLSTDHPLLKNKNKHVAAESTGDFGSNGVNVNAVVAAGAGKHAFLESIRIKNKDYDETEYNGAAVPTSLRFTNKKYRQELNPRLRERSSALSTLRVGPSANGGLLSLVKPPPATALAEHTARQAYHKAVRQYDSKSRGVNLITTLVDEDDTYDKEDEEVRLKTRQEIWAENHLSKVAALSSKFKAPTKLKRKLLKVDNRFRGDVHAAAAARAGVISGTNGTGVQSKWRMQKMQKRLEKEERIQETQKKTNANTPVSPSSTKPKLKVMSKSKAKAREKQNGKIQEERKKGRNAGDHEVFASRGPSGSKKIRNAKALAEKRAMRGAENDLRRASSWVCSKCNAQNIAIVDVCGSCGSHRPVRPAGSMKSASTLMTPNRRRRKKKTASRLNMALHIFDEVLPGSSHNLAEKSTRDEEEFSLDSWDGIPGLMPANIPSYVSSRMGTKRIGSGISGLNVAYAQSQDPNFWEHYLRDQAGATVSVLGRADDIVEKHTKQKRKMSNKQRDLSEIRWRRSKRLHEKHVKSSVFARGKLLKTLREVSPWQHDLWEEYRYILQHRDLARTDLLRSGSLLVGAEKFVDKIMNEAHTVGEAMAMVRKAASQIEKAVIQVNRNRVPWYEEVEKETPLSKPHHLMREMLLTLVHRGIELTRENLYVLVLRTHHHCGPRACNGDGPFQLLVKRMRKELNINAQEYVAWLHQNKLTVPRALLSELQQDELDRVAKEEEEAKMRAMLAAENAGLSDGVDHSSLESLPSFEIKPRPKNGLPDTLSVKILKCRRLLPADLDGLADPIVVCWCAPMWLKEGTIPTDCVRHFTDYRPKTLNPDWTGESKEFIYSISDEFWGLCVAVYDHDDHGDNDIMAFCRIGLTVIKTHGFEVTRWFTLGAPPELLSESEGRGKHSKGKNYGQVQMKIEWYNKATREWDLEHPVSENAPINESGSSSYGSTSESSSSESDIEENFPDREIN